MNIRTNILLRVYIAFGLIVLFAAAVLMQLINVQVVQGHTWRKMADSLSTRYASIEAVRGNIYSVDGSILATSIPEYEIRMDTRAGGIEDDKLFYADVDALAQKLASFFGDRTRAEYNQLLRDGREHKDRYLLIKRQVSYQQLQEIRHFPLFSVGRNLGGLIAIQKNKRVLPFKALAARTIGYKNENVNNAVGLEGAYSNYIEGETGKRLVQRIAGGVWKPVNEEAEVAPKDGADIISTIDVNLQDLAQSALERQLKTNDADHGTVVVMEVATGEIRAIANYTRVQEGEYQEKFNYAIAGRQDPGSTFKLASYMALIDAGKVDTNTLVETGNGSYQIPGHVIKESHGGLGTITVQRAFEVSSNVAIAKLVNTKFGSDPADFTDFLYSTGLNKKLGLQIPGETTPVIKNPASRSWSKMTLPQMAYGYEMQITPLQMLAFYNAVANNGRYVAPIFVKEIRRLGKPVKVFNTRVINEQICKPGTVMRLRKMLEGVVEHGTGKQIIYNPLYKVAGKTGTAQVADQDRGYSANRKYQASFCGYFPADNPKYSMIVVINNPRRNGYYAATVAGPVFREVADRVYASDMRIYNPDAEMRTARFLTPHAKSGRIEQTKQVYEALGIKSPYNSKSEYFNSIDDKLNIAFTESNVQRGVMPDVKGMGLKDALYLLGNAGVKTKLRGVGKITAQSIAPGEKINNGSVVNLILE